MENTKMPFLPEETLRTQRVEIYLNDLKERLKDLRQQHDEVIQNSVDIIKEIDDVSSSLLLPQSTATADDNITKIKKLIKEFESAKQTNSSKPPIAIESKVDIRKILQNFEKLNESHVLKESLVLFKRAKESFEKIDTYLSKIGSNHSGNPHIYGNSHMPKNTSTIDNSLTQANVTLNSKTNLNNTNPVSKESFKDKVSLFDAASENSKGTHSRYASCCSSVMSIDIFHSTEELTNLGKTVTSTTNSLENGYEGDNDDSEYDLFAMKKKKNKTLTSPL